MIIKYSLGGGKASNGTMVINTKTLKKELLRSMHGGLYKDSSSFMDIKSHLNASSYGARSPLSRGGKKKSVAS